MIPGQASARSDAELAALNRQVRELQQAGKFPEALRVAQQYVVAAGKRYGDEHSEYATAFGWLVAELITKGRPYESRPANWAPFVLVGEGAR